MTVNEVKTLLVQNVSRGAMMHGFGCVTFFVPTKSLKQFKRGIEGGLPATVDVEFLPLKIPMKKGDFQYWSPSDGKNIPEVIQNSIDRN